MKISSKLIILFPNKKNFMFFTQIKPCLFVLFFFFSCEIAYGQKPGELNPKLSVGIFAGNGALINADNDNTKVYGVNGHQLERYGFGFNYGFLNSRNYQITSGIEAIYSNNLLNIPLGIPQHIQALNSVSYESIKVQAPLMGKLVLLKRLGSINLSFNGGLCVGYNWLSNMNVTSGILKPEGQKNPQVEVEYNADSLNVNTVKNNGFVLSGRFGLSASTVIGNHLVEFSLFHENEIVNNISFYNIFSLDAFYYDSWWVVWKLKFEDAFSPRWKSWNIGLKIYFN